MCHPLCSHFYGCNNRGNRLFLLWYFYDRNNSLYQRWGCFSSTTNNVYNARSSYSILPITIKFRCFFFCTYKMFGVIVVGDAICEIIPRTVELVRFSSLVYMREIFNTPSIAFNIPYNYLVERLQCLRVKFLLL